MAEMDKKQFLKEMPVKGNLSPLERAVASVKSFYGARRYRRDFQNLEVYCMFVGYPRSGHSLIGSLLDAHPNMIVAHELDALQYVEHGFKQERVFYLLLERSRKFARSGGAWGNYVYTVPRQWNGKYKSLRVIGDKKGGRSALRLKKKPWLLSLLRTNIGIPVKLIHVTRNPFDVIATMYERTKKFDLAYKIEQFFLLCDSVAALKTQIEEHELMDIKLESFIENPHCCLKQLCDFLGQEGSENYLQDCADVVFDSTKKSRHKIKWSSEEIARVEARCAQYPFLQDYSFES